MTSALLASGFEEAAKVTPTGSGTFQLAGMSAALDGDRLAMGAPGSFIVDDQTGTVYILERDESGNWNHAAELTPDDGELGDLFGQAVALDGDTLAVGSPEHDDFGSNSGAVYVFERDAAGAWELSQELFSGDIAGGDKFGVAVSLDGDRLAVGADGNNDQGGDSGAAYLFERGENGAFAQKAKLLPSDGSSSDLFGGAVAIDGDRIVVGARQGTGLSASTGAVYLYEFDGAGTWPEVGKIRASDGVSFDFFGFALAIDGDSLVVGAIGDDEGSTNSGSVYVFERDLFGTWFNTDKLVEPTPDFSNQFGQAIDLDGDLFVTTSLDGTLGNDAGAAYLFERGESGLWRLTQTLRASDGDASDSFGQSVSLNGSRLALGATGNDEVNTFAGATYIFDDLITEPTVDLTGTCPGLILLEAIGFTPNSRLDIYAGSAGSSTLPSGPCAGTPVSLDSPTFVGSGTSGDCGERSWSPNVNPIWCGVSLQLVDLWTCAVSEVVQVPF